MIPPAFRTPEAIRSLIKIALAFAVFGALVVLFVRWAAT
jgi:hypothetical protein